MGVPAFFRWLSRKYPSIVVHCYEEKPREVNGVKVPVDASQPNPNNVEFDNLYLDMNGIIHPCCHPEDRPAPKDEDEMMIAIFEYIDRIFAIVRPRRLLYMAIDGVAPRAKMNQQRSRRFRASKEHLDKQIAIARIRADLNESGAELPPEKSKSEHFDHNCITPGTKFMARLAECLQYYVADRLNHDPGWRDIEVILSDASIPGEGEHKIMDFIRKQRASPSHDPNTHHCLCGADADLIMLGLATHEPNFTIIREEFKPSGKRPCDICGQHGHEMKDCIGLPRDKSESEEPSEPVQEKEFIFLRLPVLREYLERELRMDGLPFPFDLERAIDDWVFMCFFVGNDFLPHLPSLEIREGAIDRLVGLYKHCLPHIGGFLTKDGSVNLKLVQMIMKDLGTMEDDIFKKRQEDEMEFRRRRKEKKRRERMRQSWSGPKYIPEGRLAPQPLGNTRASMDDVQRTAALLRHVSCPPTAGANNFSAAADLRALLRRGNDPKSEASENSSSKFVSPPPRKQPTNDSDEEEPEDNVRLYEDGWRGRYYQNKFSVNPDDEQEFDNFTGKVVEAYVMGLCWVLAYYYQGCPSWKWFYPFHYAPFASDFHDIVDIDTSFDKGKPFRPLEQLMGVFPAASGCFLPDSWRDLMTDADSPIIDFYPTDFRIDLNGKKFAWQGVALLPFVDEARLRLALEDVYSNLTKEEEIRNSCGSDLLFVGKHHPARGFLETLYEQQDSQPLELNPKLARGMAGTLSVDKSRRCLPQKILPSPLPGLPKLKDNGAVCTLFRDPQFPEDFVFSAKCLPGAVHPPKTLKPQDMIGSHPGSYRPTIGFQARRQPGPNDLPREFTSGHRMAQHHVKSASSFNDRLQRTPYNPYGSVPLSQSFQPPFIPHASPHSAQFGGRPALQRHWSDPRDMYSGMRRWQPNPQPYQDYYSERQREYPKREYPKRDRRNEDQSNYGYGHPPPKRSRQY